MSILIRGMEMPCCCDECRFLDEYGDYPCCIITDEQRGYNFKTREKHMDNCHLFPVPPHGRLIDADELLQSHSVSDGIYFPDAYIPATAIKAAPTIIPAEEGE